MIRAHLSLITGGVVAIVAASASSAPTLRATLSPAARGNCEDIRELAPPRFNATTLRQGRFVYREITAGKDTGTFTLEIRRQPRFTWRFTGDGGGQHWESIADGK